MRPRTGTSPSTRAVLFGLAAAVFLAVLTVNLLLGPTCRCHLLTATGWHALSAPNAPRAAWAKAQAQIISVIQAVQGAASAPAGEAVTPCEHRASVPTLPEPSGSRSDCALPFVRLLFLPGVHHRARRAHSLRLVPQETEAPGRAPTAQLLRAARSRVIMALCGFMTAWFLLYLVGRVLLTQCPRKYHEATVWKSKVEDEIRKERNAMSRPAYRTGRAFPLAGMGRERRAAAAVRAAGSAALLLSGQRSVPAGPALFLGRYEPRRVCRRPS